MPQQRSLKDLVGLIAVLFAVLYPFLMYWGLGHLAPRVLGLIVLVFAVVRIGLVYRLDRESVRKSIPLFAAILISCLTSVLLNNSRFLLFIPVFISLTFLVAIGQSLIWPPTFIETFARRDFPILPPTAVRYCRKVTLAWCLFLGANALITTGLALAAPHAWWALYCGLISYLLMGLLFGVEFLIRKRIEPVFAAELAEMTATGSPAS